jgi:hypothetical protein
MAAALQSALRATMDRHALCVLSGKTCWLVHVDCLVLNDGGAVLGALSVAARAALAVTRLPKVVLVAGGGAKRGAGAPLCGAEVACAFAVSITQQRCVARAHARTDTLKRARILQMHRTWRLSPHAHTHSHTHKYTEGQTHTCTQALARAHT